MRIYYEAIEDNVPVEDSRNGEGQTAEFIRVDVTENTPEERMAIMAALDDLMAGKTYHLQAHGCTHDEGKPCSLEALP